MTVWCLRTHEDATTIDPVLYVRRGETNEHIRQFPYEISHYGRNRTNKRYLRPDLSVRNMYVMFVEKEFPEVHKQISDDNLQPEWGAHPATVRTTALALCFSTAEFACSSWGRSRHTWHVDIALNDTCRIITGCLNATPIPCLFALAGIAPPDIRRKVASNADSCLQEDDTRHPLHGQRPAKHRLPSTNSFIDSTESPTTSKQDVRTTLWVDEWNALGDRSTEWRDRGIIPNEHLASSTD